jgi:alanine racemase
LKTKFPVESRAAVAEIDLGAIAHNLLEIKKRVAPAKVMAVVKANAYGHGAVAVAKTAVEHGVDYFGVARVEEGVELREAGITKPILVLGGFFEAQIAESLKYNLELTLYDRGLAAVLSKRARPGKPARVHLKIDTGMGRVGAPWQQAAQFVQQIGELANIEMVGVYTHLSSADESDPTYSNTQLARFRKIILELESQGVRMPLKHAANSGALLNWPESFFDLVRPGVSLYGYYPAAETARSLPLRPAMSIKSRVIFIKEVEKDAFISYNRTYQARQKTRVATVAIGYADGYNRLLSNRGEVLIRGRRWPVIGRVTMDQIMVDIGAASEIQIGDEVVLLGRQGGEEITIYEICEKLNTIPYEVTCWVSERVARVYKNNR